jgi:hypothetical protein
VQAAVGGLPLPLDAAQLVAAFDHEGEEVGKQVEGLPTLERAMERTVIPKRFGQMVPLAAGAPTIENAVQGFAGIGSRTPGQFGWVAFGDEGLHRFPQAIGNVPEGRQRLALLVVCLIGLFHLLILLFQLDRWLYHTFAVLRWILKAPCPGR